MVTVITSSRSGPGLSALRATCLHRPSGLAPTDEPDGKKNQSFEFGSPAVISIATHTVGQLRYLTPLSENISAEAAPSYRRRAPERRFLTSKYFVLEPQDSFASYCTSKTSCDA